MDLQVNAAASLSSLVTTYLRVRASATAVMLLSRQAKAETHRNAEENGRLQRV